MRTTSGPGDAGEHAGVEHREHHVVRDRAGRAGSPTGSRGPAASSNRAGVVRGRARPLRGSRSPIASARASSPSRLDHVEHRERTGAHDGPAAERRGVLTGPEREIGARDAGRRSAARRPAPWPGSPRRAPTPEREIASQSPQRPMPDCTSSAIEQRPRARRTSAAPRAGSRPSSGSTPPSPITGSSSTAPTSGGHRGVERARGRRAGRTGTSPRAARTAARFAGCPVAASAATVRPWKDPSSATIAGLPAREPVLARELDRGFVRLGPRVGRRRPARRGWAAAPRAASASCSLRLGGEEVAHHVERADLRRASPRPTRGGECPMARDAERAREVEELPARRRPTRGCRRRAPGSAGTARTWASRRARAASRRRSPALGPARLGVGRDHRADALGREQLQDQRVLDPAVHQVHPAARRP